MARRTFYDMLNDMDFSPTKECGKLMNLFAEEQCIWANGNVMSLQEYVDEAYFRKLTFRGTFTDTTEMISALFLDINLQDIQVDELFTICEFLLAILPEQYTRVYNQVYAQAQTITGNINSILEKTNHMLYDIGTTDEPRMVVVEKNRMTTQAVELITDNVVAIDMIEYNRFSMKGNLAGKKKALMSIANYIEPILRAKTLQNGGHKQLESDMGFLLNNFHVRHNNKTGAKAQDYIVSMSDSELETWYDKIYNTELAVIIMSEQIAITSELQELKQKYSWKA